MYDQFLSRLTALRAYLVLAREKIIDYSIKIGVITFGVLCAAMFYSSVKSMNPFWLVLTPLAMGILCGEAGRNWVNERHNAVEPASTFEITVIRACMLWLFFALSWNGAKLHPVLWLVPGMLGFFFVRPRYMPCAIDNADKY